MNRSDSHKIKNDALVKILEGEVMLLKSVIDEALHWDEPRTVRAAICRIRHKAQQIAINLDVPLPEAGGEKDE